MSREEERRPLLSRPRLDIQPWVEVKQTKYPKKSAHLMGDQPNQNGDEEAQGSNPTKKQNSLVTVFAVWNTMMGTSLLAMPWGIEKAGLALGAALTLTMGALCLYTAHSNIRVHAMFGTAKGEISQLARDLLGSTANKMSKIFSVIVLLGANLVYWILMSNFLYNSISYAHDNLIGSGINPIMANSSTVICPADLEDLAVGRNRTDTTTFDAWWNLELTVPIFLSVIVAPLLSFKSPTFFTKFNSLGTLSVAYLVVYVIVKAWSWGWVTIDFNDVTSPHFVPLVKTSFPATAGMLALSYFIHNIIITIMRSNRNPKNNGRDLTIAYTLVVITYLIIGVLFYISFPLAKTCIQDNLLNNLTKWDPLTVVGRVFLLFQLVTVFPLISYMLRNEVMLMMTGSIWPGLCPVFLFNIALVILCILTAIFLPHIGTIIRYTGAISGLVHIFTLPCLLRLVVQRKTSGSISVGSLLLNTLIPILGAANLIGQFFVTE